MYIGCTMLFAKCSLIISVINVFSDDISGYLYQVYVMGLIINFYFNN